MYFIRNCRLEIDIAFDVMLIIWIFKISVDEYYFGLLWGLNYFMDGNMWSF